MHPFSDRLMDAVHRFGPLCVGIDPHPHLFPKLFGTANADNIANWANEIIDIAKDHAAVIKPQAAFFERFGAPGFAALDIACKTARDAGILVILDAKRGDIGSTAKGYASAYLSNDAAMPVDALTVNPFMGYETLDPFIDTAADAGNGIAVLTRTSNPGAADIEEQIIGDTPLYMTLAKALSRCAPRLAGKSTRWSGLMMVAGATAPEEARAIREAAPDNLFLVPGYGAQGAGASAAVASFVKGKDGKLEGGVVNASRSVTFPQAAQTAPDLKTWRSAIKHAIISAQEDLNAACSA